MDPRAVCSANTWRCLGANSATQTRPESVLCAAVWRARGARRGDESRRHSAAQQSSRALEGRQAARCEWGQRFFWCLLRRQMGCSQYRQERIRPHGQRDMSIPPRPTAYLIVIQPDLALRLFKTPFDGPSTARHPYDVCQGRPLWGKHDVGRQRRRVAQTPTNQEPAALVGLPRRGQGEPHPVIPAWTFGPIAGAQPVPALRHQRRQDAFDLVLPTSPPDIFFP
jgi:hypothetical protein